MDEMHIKRDLVYDKHTGELIGFTNLGDMNMHLLNLEKSLDQCPSEELTTPCTISKVTVCDNDQGIVFFTPIPVCPISMLKFIR